MGKKQTAEEFLTKAFQGAYMKKKELEIAITTYTVAYKKGYTQCQEDMADKKYTEKDVINALHSVELKNNKDYSKIFEGMKEYFNVLNKKD